MRALQSCFPLVLCLLLLSVACSGSKPEPPPPADLAAQEGTADPADQSDTESSASQTGDSAASDASPASDQAVSQAGPADLPVIAEDPDRYDWLDFQTYPDAPWGFRSVLAVFTETDNSDFDMMGLEYICDARVGLWVLVAAYPSYDGAQRGIAAPLNANLGFPASAVFSGSPGGGDRYLEFDALDATFAQHSNGVEFMSTSMAYESVTIRLPFAENYITAEFDLRGVFDTPIQPNLDWCGAY